MEELTFKPLTPETWKSFEELFGPKGACGGCWCMTWRLQKAEYEKLKGEGNRKAMQKLVRQGEPIGLLAFVNGEPVAWCAVAPREKYVRLEKSRALKPVDDQKVWSVSCFFVAKPFRRKGLSVPLLKATIRHAAKQGAKIIEAYPVEPKDGNLPDVFAWTGIAATFIAAGFEEVIRHTPPRPIMRFYL